MMELNSWWWYGVLISLTAACLIAMAGVRSAKQHAIGPHSRRMIGACTIVGIWLVAYLSQQFLFGRERFGGTPAAYWSPYAPAWTFSGTMPTAYLVYLMLFVWHPAA